jgi:hypothetical protein
MSTLPLLLENSAGELKAFDFAMELAKQLISLSIGILGVSITFTKDFFKYVPKWVKYILTISWIAYFLSITFGILHIMALTGSLSQDYKTIPDSAKLFASFQIFSFGLATFLIVIYGIVGLFRYKKP